MALFKILKGSSSALGKTGNSTYKATEGYAYFTQDDGKFYIDIADANQAQVGVNRIPLNARAADYLVGTDVAGRNLIQNTLFKDNNNLPNLNGIYHFTPASNCTLTASDAHGLILKETAACQAALYLGSSSNTANANQIKINNLDALAVNTEYTLAFDLDYKLLSGATNSTTYYVNLDLYVDKTTAGTFDTTALQSKRVAEITSARKGITVTGTRVEFTFVLPTNVTMLYFRLYCTNTTANQYAVGDFLQLNNMKLERGPIATYWTPAPEDERRYLILNNKTLQLGNSYSLSDLNLASGNGRIFYGTCATAAGTAAKVVTCADYNQLQTGDILVVSFSNTNTAAVANLTLNVNGKGAKNIKKLYNANIANLTSTNELCAKAIALFVYNGTYWILSNADYNNTYSYMFPYENTSTSGAAKQAKIAIGGWKFQLTAGKQFPYTHYYDNTYQGAFTLNIGGTGDKPVWINGKPSSSSNYTLPGGNYIVYYDGTNYHFRTDGVMPGKTQTGRYFHNVVDYGTTGTPKEILIKTKIPYMNGNVMPKLIFHMDNYDPGLPTELGLVFYIYNGEFCNYSATSNTEHRPVITLSSYTENGQEYIAIGLGLIGTAVLPEAYYIHFNIDMFEYWPSNLTRDYSQDWSVIDNTADDASIIPTEHRVTVNYKDYTAKAGSAATISTSGGTTAKFWRGDNTWSDTISGGTLKISNHSITLEIGAQNTSQIHFTNGQDKSYYFDHQISAVNGFRVYNTNTTLTNNNLTFANGGGWAMTDETWIRTVGSKSVYMNAGTFRNDGTTLLKLLHHVNVNIVTDGTWETGGTGTDNSGDNYATRGTLGTSVLSIGNAIARPAAGTAGGKNNSKGYLRIYGEGTGYGELSYNDSMFASNKSIYLTNTANSGISNEIRGITAANDYWRVAGGATASNAGYMEIATADDGNEPIYVRQYTGVFSTLKRTATLLDASGNTEFPVSVTAPTFIGSLSGNATSSTDAANTQSNYGAKEFIVEGDANTYYPVWFSGYTKNGAWTLLNIHRNYNEQAPDTWNTSTHRNGLTLTILSNGDTAWGGNHALGVSKLNTIIDLSEQYSTVVADMQVTNFGLVIWLRGGGAKYWVTSNGGRSVTVTPWYESHTQSSSTVAPTTTINTTRINSFRWNNLWTITNATQFSSNRTIALTGAITGSASANGSSGWSIATTVNHTHNYITSRGNVTCETAGNKPAQAGLSMSNVYNNGYPVTYGNVLTMYGDGAGQLLLGWSGSSTASTGVHSGAYIRSQRDTVGTLWSDWVQLLDAKNTYVASSSAVSVNWNTETTIATINGTAVKIKIPANPNTNTDTLVKQTVKTDNVNYKLLATTSAAPSSGTAMEATYSAYIFANPSTGALSAPQHMFNIGGTNKAYMSYNSTDDSIDFIFM